MTIRHLVIAAVATVGFAFATSAATVSQPALSAPGSSVTLIGHNHHHHHRGHWRHGRRHRHDGGPFCMIAIAPWCWQ